MGGPQYEFKAPYDPPAMVATREELKASRVPLDYRDYCAHLLIPLNQCRCASRARVAPGALQRRRRAVCRPRVCSGRCAALAAVRASASPLSQLWTRCTRLWATLRAGGGERGTR